MQADCDSGIRKYLEGDEEAFRVLFEPLTPHLLECIGRQMAPLLKRKVSVRDVLQEVSIVAFERRETFTGTTRDDFKRWVGAIADRTVLGLVNHHAGTHKRALFREVSRPGRGATKQLAGAGASPSEEAIAAETKDLVEKALQQLPPDYRDVLRLCREEGLSLREVGERIGRSREAAKKLHGRAMVQFIESFERLRRGEHD